MCGCPGFYRTRERLASLFFRFLNQRLHGPNGFYPIEKGKDLEANGNSAVTFPARSPRQSRWPFPLRIMRRRVNGGASSASPRISSPVVPLQHVQFALVRQLSAVNVTVTYWIVRYVLPFLCVRFRSAQLPVPRVALPDRNIDTMRPRACDMISPELNPFSQGFVAEKYSARRINGCDPALSRSDRRARRSLLPMLQEVASLPHCWPITVFDCGCTLSEK